MVNTFHRTFQALWNCFSSKSDDPVVEVCTCSRKHFVLKGFLKYINQRRLYQLARTSTTMSFRIFPAEIWEIIYPTLCHLEHSVKTTLNFHPCKLLSEEVSIRSCCTRKFYMFCSRSTPPSSITQSTRIQRRLQRYDHQINPEFEYPLFMSLIRTTPSISPSNITNRHGTCETDPTSVAFAYLLKGPVSELIILSTLRNLTLQWLNERDDIALAALILPFVALNVWESWFRTALGRRIRVYHGRRWCKSMWYPTKRGQISRSWLEIWDFVMSERLGYGARMASPYWRKFGRCSK